MQSGDVPVTDVIAAFGFTVTLCEAETVPPQPPVIVNIMLAEPAETPVTVFPLTVATPVFKLTHVPPDDGVRVVVEPIHIFDDAANTVGLGFIVTALVVFEQPVVVFVNVNVELP